MYCCTLGIPTNNVRLFSYNSLRSATRNFHPSNRIGGGGYGVVYKVRSMNIIFVVDAFVLTAIPHFLERKVSNTHTEIKKKSCQYLNKELK